MLQPEEVRAPSADVENQETASPPPESPRPRSLACCGRCAIRCCLCSWKVKCFAGCCTCILLLVAVLAIVAYFVIRNILVKEARRRFYNLDEAGVTKYTGEGLGMDNLTYNTYWPGCKDVTSMSDFDSECGRPCFDADLMYTMQTFNFENDAVRVTYPSRPGVESVTLEGWWLPAAVNGSTAPRIVVQHGFRENTNHYRHILHAYLLRSLGFSVLLNNLRDHGYSGRSTEHINMWGDDDYVHDLLGAWDFAVNDPQGVLGAALPASRVGLSGMSMGAFTVLNSFGLESSVPAAWADSAFMTPDIVFATGAERRMNELGIGFVSGLFIDSVWSTVQDEAKEIGVDWAKNTPELTLARGGDLARPVFLVANVDDEVIPQSTNGQHEQLVTLVKSMPEKYTLSGTYVGSGGCHGEEHVVDHLHHFNDYRSKACLFWRPVFGMDASDCDATA